MQRRKKGVPWRNVVWGRLLGLKERGWPQMFLRQLLKKNILISPFLTPPAALRCMLDPDFEVVQMDNDKIPPTGCGQNL